MHTMDKYRWMLWLSVLLESWLATDVAGYCCCCTRHEHEVPKITSAQHRQRPPSYIHNILVNKYTRNPFVTFSLLSPKKERVRERETAATTALKGKTCSSSFQTNYLRFLRLFMIFVIELFGSISMPTSATTNVFGLCGPATACVFFFLSEHPKTFRGR